MTEVPESSDRRQNPADPSRERERPVESNDEASPVPEGGIPPAPASSAPVPEKASPGADPGGERERPVNDPASAPESASPAASETPYPAGANPAAPGPSRTPPTPVPADVRSEPQTEPQASARATSAQAEACGSDSSSPDEEPALMTPELEREVASAMAGWEPGDVAELTGEVSVTDPDSLAAGTELTGMVVGVSGDDVFLEFGVKAQGVIPRAQFGKKEVLGAGRRVDVVVERYDPDAGLLLVSRKGTLQRATWTNLTMGMLVEGRITGLNKGGLEVDLKGIRAFMPASQVDPTPMKDISVFIGQKVRCEVIDLNRRSKNVLLSRRKVVERELAEKREKLRSELEAGQLRKGVVANITDFGAFVDLGGLEGLVHIRDLSWGGVEKVSDVLSKGQEVEVMVLKLDSARHRISLGLKQALPDPWIDVPERYPVGTQLKVRIVRMANFGVFAELESGVEGLIPISEMGWARVIRPSNLVSVGDLVDVVVIRLEADNHRMALSMKQAQPDPWEGVLESFTEQSLVTGRVTRLVDFGAFVELTPGVEGLIHISELSEGRVKTCRDVVEAGQEVEVRVLGIDKDSRRISLSIKAVKAPPVGAQPEATAGKPAKPKKRKKPLRGGLASHFDW